METLTLELSATALVVIDLQKGIARQPAEPYPAEEVTRNASLLADACRRNGIPVFLVHVITTPETMLRPDSDELFSSPAPLPPDWSEFMPEIGPFPSDIVITKRQWGAFYGTDLELHLRRRGIRTLILSGISTNFGVESTARFAYELGFQQIFAEDAMTSRSAEGHKVAVTLIFPRMGRVRTTAQILAALE